MIIEGCQDVVAIANRAPKQSVYTLANRKEKDMQKWEYNMFSSDVRRRKKGGMLGKIEEGCYLIWNDKNDAGKTDFDKITEMGLNGWELVSVTPVAVYASPNMSGATYEILFTFKRPIE